MAVGVWLLCLGAFDVIREHPHGARRAPAYAGLLAAVVALPLLLVHDGPGASDVALAALVGLGLLGWGRAGVSVPSGRRAWPPAAAAAAVLVPSLVLTLLSRPIDRATGAALGAGVDTVLAAYGLDVVVVVSGAVLVQLSTANRLVRLLLDAVGNPVERNEQRLKGGRVLGPLERVFLLVLSLGGALGAAAIVVAAKGLLRYPELRRASEEHRDTGPTRLSEYFLLGSLASWLVAIGTWAMVRLVL